MRRRPIACTVIKRDKRSRDGEPLGWSTVDGFLDWWDSVEEWLTGLSFVPQVLVSVAVLIPLAIACAYLLNMLVNGFFWMLDRVRSTGTDGED